jgi:serine/threonine protein kinase
MGEVYRARDERLNRDCAIKVLPEAVANEPDRLARFEREAKALATLSHPNILAIHDFGVEGDVTYAATELLEGETLRERLDEGAVGWRRAIEICAAIADGLAAAHDAGIVSLKVPSNLSATTRSCSLLWAGSRYQVQLPRHRRRGRVKTRRCLRPAGSRA